MPAGSYVDVASVSEEILADDLALTVNGKGLIMKSTTGRSLRIVASDVGESDVALDKDETYPAGGA